MGFEVDGESTWCADAGTAGANVDHAHIEQLFPNCQQLKSILAHTQTERLVIVGTLQAFDDVRRTRDSYKRKARLGGELTEAELVYIDTADSFLAFLSEFDMVIIDEGHYEPAPSWSRSVRSLDLPTVLLSATPFRNDYKLFRVRGRFICNMPFPVAEEQRVVRSVEFITEDSIVPISHNSEMQNEAQQLQEIEIEVGNNTTAIRVTQADRDEVSRFVALLSATVPDILLRAEDYTETPKIVIRAGSFEILLLLQQALAAQFQDLLIRASSITLFFQMRWHLC